MYKYLFFAFKDDKAILTNGVKHCTGFYRVDAADTIVTGLSYNPAYALVINGEIYGPGIEYMNYILSDAGLYLTRQDARDIYNEFDINLNAESCLEDHIRPLLDYGQFSMQVLSILPGKVIPNA